MNRDKQLTLITEFFLERKNTMVAKGEDYATQDDVLSNFKFAGNICGISPEKQILSLIATKVARLGNLLDGDRKPNHESVDDTIKDLGCYTDLLYCLRRDIDKPTQKGILAKMMEQDEKDGLYDDYFQQNKSQPLTPDECTPPSNLDFKAGDRFRYKKEDLVYTIYQINDEFYYLQHNVVRRSIRHDCFELEVADGKWKQL